ncbi:hypothetical protein DFS34DRAFT_695609 [Phlyctochytrium arcticum]|nr:hypothetical protein DFS34DRAFT_695609 [Phlyctochytrium arcticum]
MFSSSTNSENALDVWDDIDFPGDGLFQSWLKSVPEPEPRAGGRWEESPLHVKQQGWTSDCFDDDLDLADGSEKNTEDLLCRSRCRSRQADDMSQAALDEELFEEDFCRDIHFPQSMTLCRLTPAYMNAAATELTQAVDEQDDDMEDLEFPETGLLDRLKNPTSESRSGGQSKSTLAPESRTPIPSKIPRLLSTRYSPSWGETGSRHESAPDVAHNLPQSPSIRQQSSRTLLRLPKANYKSDGFELDTIDDLTPLPTARQSLKRRGSEMQNERSGSSGLRNDHFQKTNKSRKPVLIRHLNHGDEVKGNMVYNPKSQVWEGNESALHEFDKVDSFRPSLIKNDQSNPLPTRVGEMTFDPVAMRWVGNEDDDVFADIPDNMSVVSEHASVTASSEFELPRGTREDLCLMETAHKLFIGKWYPTIFSRGGTPAQVFSKGYLYEIRTVG